MQLIPQPKSITHMEGAFKVAEDTRIFLPPELERPEWIAAKELDQTFLEKAKVNTRLDRTGLFEDVDKGIFLSIRQPSIDDPIKRDGYTLTITPKAISVTGNSNSGLFYGIQTLRQIVGEHGASLPALEIVDEPDFEWRGFYYDVSRGKVPTMETMKYLVDYLAALKVNMFQLYVEHPFEFRFDPEIAQNENGLTSEEILELQIYCQDRRVEFVPSLQSFGHMAGVLSLPQYRELADVELEGEWDDLSWHQRMRGATIDISNEKAKALLEQMYDHYLPLFDSNFINACADETYDLGMGKTKELAEERGKGRLYLDHIEYLNDLSHRYDKRMMFWGDIIKHHEDLVPAIPKDAILLNWGYSRDTDFESTRLFAEAGLDFLVCPGTSGWNRLLNGIGNASENIVKYAQTGKKYGAIGVLNTDWGDHGHYNPLGGSLHGIALGAAVSWNVDRPTIEEFDGIWSAQMFGDPDARLVRDWRKLTNEADFYTWISFYPTYAGEKPKWVHEITTEEAQKLIENSKSLENTVEEYKRENQADPILLQELYHTARMHGLLGEKALIGAELAAGRKGDELSTRLTQYANKVREHRYEYEQIWLARNKPAELHEVLERFDAIAEEAEQLATEAKE